MGVSKDLLATFEEEHDALAAALADTRAAMTRFRSSGSAVDAAAARQSFVTLQTVATTHLDHEEAELEPVFQAKRETPEIKAMGRKFGQVSPAKGGRFFAWVTDGASKEELEAIGAEVPKPVLMIIGGIFGRGYRRDVASVWTS
jgi:hypothetical protein